MKRHLTNNFHSGSFAILIMVVLGFCGCEKDITLDLETAPEMIVVEGHIEPGYPPYVILTHTLPYFELTDIDDLEKLFVHDANITVTEGANTYTLTEFCSDSMPDSLLNLASLYLGVDIDDLTNYNFCVYTSALDTGQFFSTVLGQLGKTYKLKIKTQGKTLTATTTLPYPIPLDSMWFVERSIMDGFGQIYVKFSDPAGSMDYYRMFTQRLGTDDYMIPTAQSLLTDVDINGTTVDLLFKRGFIPGRADGNLGFYEIGDTVVLKWCTMDYGHYEFWRTAQIEFDNVGNPIASSTQIKSNVEGGLGIWGAYGAIYDTLIIK